MKYSYEHEVVTPVTGLAIKYYLCNVQQNPLHWHRELELLCCVDGEVEVITPNSRKILHAGDILLINRNDVHRVLGEKKDNTSVIIQFDMRAFTSLVPDIERFVFSCDSTINDGKDYTQLWSLVRNFADTIRRKDEGYYLELGAIRNQIIVELIRNFGYMKQDVFHSDLSDEGLSRLVHILEYIESNLKNKITLQDIADKSYLNPYYFSHYFHDKIGMSFRQYLTYTRVHHARELLLSTKYRILDIAIECGFSSAQSFSRAFKEEFGKSPGEYRHAMDDKDESGMAVEGHRLVMIDPVIILERIDALEVTSRY